MPGSSSISSTFFRIILHNQLKELWKKNYHEINLSDSTKSKNISNIQQSAADIPMLYFSASFRTPETCPILGTSIVSYTMLHELKIKFFITSETKGMLLFFCLGMQRNNCRKNLLGFSALFFWYFKHNIIKEAALCSNFLEGGYDKFNHIKHCLEVPVSFYWLKDSQDFKI